ncbi:MAG: polyprenyl synthetase family protein [Clostridia bacterium]|nr:polyprenyl synthetase family protein [Clostridia bacterium]
MSDLELVLKEKLTNSGSKYAGIIYEAMSYSIFGAGKRIRPLLAELFCEAAGGKRSSAVYCASAVEMIHTYSLIHDDLPCMDNDELRRGRAANHIVYGEDTALLAGDGLLTRAFEVCLCPENVSGIGADSAIKAAHYLAVNAGADGMVGGQCIDLSTENRDITEAELYDMVYGKTVCLIKAACVMGVISAHGDDTMIKAAEDFAEGVGMAFQIRDDVLDVIGTAEKMGKKTGVDSDNNRRNFVTMYGLEKAQNLVNDYTEKALDSLSVFPNDTTELKELAISLINREN